MAKRDYDNWSKEELVREVQKLESRKKYGLIWDEGRELLTISKMSVITKGRVSG